MIVANMRDAVIVVIKLGMDVMVVVRRRDEQGWTLYARAN